MNAVDQGSEALTEYREITLQELLRHEYIDVNPDGGYVIVSEKRPVQLAGPAPTPSMTELGYTSMSPWTAWTREEKLPNLRGKLGTRQWYDMKRNDGTVRGSLGLLKTPIRAARWYIEPGGDTTVDENIAEFIRECLFDNMNVSWSSVLDDILLMLEYGYMPFEKVFKFDKKARVVLKKLAPRHPLDISEWVYDAQGGPAGIVMEPFVPYGNINAGQSTSMFPFQNNLEANLGQFIPISKLIIFSFEAEAGDLSGTSVLRSAYKHWYYKDTLYKIDAIQKERHGIGIPVIKLPPGFSDDDKRLADELGRNLRTNDRAHIVIPANWEIGFAKLEGQPVDAIKSIEHHNSELRSNVLAPFMNDSNGGESSMDMFFKSTRYLADQISNIFNKFVIPQLVDMNFSRGKYPKLRARRIGEWNDLRTWSFAFRNLVGASAIIPDDPTEDFLRNELDLPKRDPATARQIEAPQGPEGGDGEGDANVPGKVTAPKPGEPRQAKKANVAPPRNNAGRDSSGGG